MSKNSNTVRTSQVTMHELVLPNDTNNLGNVLGGRVMHLMDICAAMSAYKHARTHVVTASVDNMNFLVPVHVGAVVGCYTEVVNVGRSSIQVIVEVWIDKGISGEKIKVTEGLFVFVAIDNNGRTRAVS